MPLGFKRKKIYTKSGVWGECTIKEVAYLNPMGAKLPPHFNYIDLESVKGDCLLKTQVISISDAPIRAQRLLMKGDILFQTVRPYQKNNLFFNLEDGDYVASTGYIQLRSLIDNKFLYYVVSTDGFVKEVLRLCVGSNYPAITSSDFSRIVVKVPSIPEQKAIVSVIEKWDRYLELLDKKIEVKKNIKKYLTYDLLLDSANSKESRLSDFVSVLKGRGLSKKQLDDKGDQECILYGELYTRYREIIREVYSRTNVVDGIKSVIGDVLIPASTTTNALDVATASCLVKGGVLLGGDINVLRPKQNVLGEFLAYYLSYAKKLDMAKLAQGITIVHLYGSDIKKIKVQIPSLEEQRRITSILSNADKEIEILQQQRSLIEQQRKYLINNLVTGNIRLPKFKNIK